ncbi:MAG TPA: hypothetical protein VJP80_04930 [Candidatus Saccharimonadales bacterium]|nr:hypothetical protein [Candidatus Saccharimonadales bacterium]
MPERITLINQKLHEMPEDVLRGRLQYLSGPSFASTEVVVGLEDAEHTTWMYRYHAAGNEIEHELELPDQHGLRLGVAFELCMAGGFPGHDCASVQEYISGWRDTPIITSALSLVEPPREYAPASPTELQLGHAYTYSYALDGDPALHDVHRVYGIDDPTRSLSSPGVIAPLVIADNLALAQIFGQYIEEVTLPY